MTKPLNVQNPSPSRISRDATPTRATPKRRHPGRRARHRVLRRWRRAPSSRTRDPRRNPGIPPTREANRCAPRRHSPVAHPDDVLHGQRLGFEHLDTADRAACQRGGDPARLASGIKTMCAAYIFGGCRKASPAVPYGVTQQWNSGTPSQAPPRATATTACGRSKVTPTRWMVRLTNCGAPIAIATAVTAAASNPFSS
jgi:hypothetical protein